MNWTDPEERRRYQREWARRPDVIAKRKAYNAQPEVKARKAALRSARDKTPEGREKKRLAMRRYRSDPDKGAERRAKHRGYWHSERRIARDIQAVNSSAPLTRADKRKAKAEEAKREGEKRVWEIFLGIRR